MDNELEKLKQEQRHFNLKVEHQYKEYAIKCRRLFIGAIITTTLGLWAIPVCKLLNINVCYGWMVGSLFLVLTLMLFMRGFFAWLER